MSTPLRCRACGWVTKRRYVEDQGYGVCRCGGPLDKSGDRRAEQRQAQADRDFSDFGLAFKHGRSYPARTA